MGCAVVGGGRALGVASAFATLALAALAALAAGTAVLGKAVGRALNGALGGLLVGGRLFSAFRPGRALRLGLIRGGAREK